MSKAQGAAIAKLFSADGNARKTADKDNVDFEVIYQ